MGTNALLSPIFFPEDSTYFVFEFGRSSGLPLTFHCLPIATNRNSGGDCKKFIDEVYSYGYSSGITPDSLFIEVLRWQNTRTNNRCTSIRYSG